MQIWLSDNMGNISVELAPSETDEVSGLISELDQTLAANYRPEERHGVPLDALFQPRSDSFWRAWTAPQWDAEEWHSSPGSLR
jgi:hypothetical protein